MSPITDIIKLRVMHRFRNCIDFFQRIVMQIVVINNLLLTHILSSSSLTDDEAKKMQKYVVQIW